MTSLPAWLSPGRDISHSKNPQRLARSIDYFTKMFGATPQWMTDQQRADYRAVYRKMRRMRKAGHNVTVDHIVPLRHNEVCGLNVPWNLKIIPAKENFSKGNRHWPDSPHEILEMFDFSNHPPFQKRLF